MYIRMYIRTYEYVYIRTHISTYVHDYTITRCTHQVVSMVEGDTSATGSGAMRCTCLRLEHHQQQRERTPTSATTGLMYTTLVST